MRFYARAFVGDEPFAVLLGDDLYMGKVPAIKELIDEYNKYQSTIVGTLEVSPSETKKYGICDPEKAMDSKTYKLRGGC